MEISARLIEVLEARRHPADCFDEQQKVGEDARNDKDAGDEGAEEQKDEHLGDPASYSSTQVRFMRHFVHTGWEVEGWIPGKEVRLQTSGVVDWAALCLCFFARASSMLLLFAALLIGRRRETPH